MRTRPWEVDDALWARVQPHLPPPPFRLRGGRSRVDDRACFAAILYVLRTGMQWNALPKEVGCSSSTAHRRFQEWEAGGFFERLHAEGLMEYDALEGIEWEWQAVDGAMTKAPLGGAATGANPTDRGKSGTKRSMLTDGGGLPLAIVVAGANRHDKKLLAATLDGLVVARPAPSEEAPRLQHLTLDRGYDYPDSQEEAASRGYEVHIPLPRGQERSKPYAEGSRPRRWVVERAHSWLNRSRRLLVRWEKKSENYLAMLHLACAQLIFSKLGRLTVGRPEQPNGSIAALAG